MKKSKSRILPFVIGSILGAVTVYAMKKNKKKGR